MGLYANMHLQSLDSFIKMTEECKDQTTIQCQVETRKVFVTLL